MLSGDKNTRSVTQLIEAIKEYVSLEKQCLRFDITEKLVRLSMAVILFLLVFVLSAGILFYLSFALIYELAPKIGWGTSYLIVAAVFMLLLIIVVCKRRQLIERPLTRFFADVFLKK